MWQANTKAVASGHWYGILDHESPLPFRCLFELLATDDDFADWYADLLAGVEFDACYWELPPLTTETLDKNAEFVLIGAPTLERMTTDPATFASHFRASPNEEVVVFPNLGGDATLIAPCPRGPGETYTHLARFLRRAARDQIRALWRVTAETLLARLAAEPIWLSTSGTGVGWLHVRLDSWPKYYQHQPYKRYARE